MSEPIIIETPAPPTRERLVLVPLDACNEVREGDPRVKLGAKVGLTVLGTHARDATPADLARGGYERLGPEVLRVSAAEWHAMKLRAEGLEAHGEPGTLAHLRNDLRDAEKRAEKAERALRCQCSDAGPSGVHDSRVVALRAVAARVRQERCLVAQAVGMGAGVTASRTSERVPGTTGMWDVYVTRRPDVPGEHYAYGVPTADVPATLARLLEEVARG